MTQTCKLSGFIFANRDLGLHLLTKSPPNFPDYAYSFYLICSESRRMQQQQTLVYGPLPTRCLPPGEVPIQPQTYQTNDTMRYVSVTVKLNLAFYHARHTREAPDAHNCLLT